MSQFDLMVLPVQTVPRRTRQRGHAALPGGGPDGETCRGCKHFVRIIMSKTFFKCGLMRLYWTGGIATDIRASDKACHHWEKQP